MAICARLNSMSASSVAIVAGVILTGFTVWITRQAKALEQDLDSTSQKIVLLNRPAPDFHLTSTVGRAVSLRHVPKLRFAADETFDTATRIEELLLEPEVARDLKHPLQENAEDEDEKDYPA